MPDKKYLLSIMTKKGFLNAVHFRNDNQLAGLLEKVAEAELQQPFPTPTHTTTVFPKE